MVSVSAAAGRAVAKRVESQCRVPRRAGQRGVRPRAMRMSSALVAATVKLPLVPPSPWAPWCWRPLIVNGTAVPCCQRALRTHAGAELKGRPGRMLTVGSSQ